MKCEKAIDMISAYIDGVLNKEEQEEFMKHIESCESCAAELKALTELTNSLRDIPLETVPSGAHEKFVSALEDIKPEEIPPEPQKAQKNKKQNLNKFKNGFFRNMNRNWRKYSAIAAAVVVCAVVIRFLPLGMGGMGAQSSAPKEAYDGGMYYVETTQAATMASMESIEQESFSMMANMTAGGALSTVTTAEMPAADPAAEMEDLKEAVEADDAMAEGRSIVTDGDENGELPQTTEASEEDENASEKGKASDRMIIRNLNATLEVEDFDYAVEELRRFTEGVGGYVESFDSYIYHSDSARGIELKEGHIVLRLPREVFDSGKDMLSELGKVEHENEYTDDVTAQYIDTQGRLNMRRTEEARLLELLAKCDTVEEMMLIEQRLSEIRYELESYQTQLNNWDRLVSLSTFRLQIIEREDASITVPSKDFGEKAHESFIRGINGFLEFWQDFALGVTEGFLVIVIVIVVIVVVINVFRKKIFKRGGKNEKK
ncbi:MAG: DUF4349 domain-containing protein [Firmicutes bacterium]|nr:DUF4349 domain-containing protein [Bacillota bacterium]